MRLAFFTANEHRLSQCPYIGRIIVFIAFGVMLSLSAQATITPVYQINDTSHTYLQSSLNHDIYRYSSNPNLSDLVVIDNLGNKLPYRLVNAELSSPQAAEISSVRFFPVPQGSSTTEILTLDTESIKIQQADVTLRAKIVKSINRDAPIDFYIVDVTGFKSGGHELLLDWNADEKNQYLEVQVSGSRDLKNWQLLSEHALAKLKKNGQSLIRNTIPLAASGLDFNYLRLKFLRGSPTFQLTQVQLRSERNVIHQPATDTWKIQGALAKDQDSAWSGKADSTTIPVAAWEYEREDRAPINQLGIDLGTISYGDSIRIYSRHSNKQQWHLLYQGIWFNAQIGSDWQHSNAVSVYTNSDPYWRVELVASVRAVTSPLLVFELKTKMLQFIANKSAPYRIAIDSDAKVDNQQTSESILLQLIADNTVDWVTSDYTSLEPGIHSDEVELVWIDWKTLIFWMALSIAVVVLVVLSVRLLKQMK